ncbi:MAG: Lon-like protease helical domain-containing protein [Limnohabitans sp.]
MACQRLEPADLSRRVHPDSLGFASTGELVEQPLPWIGQPRAEAAARFGLGMALPGYNLLVVGEVGTGRTTLMRQLMRHHAATCPVPPDLLYLHQVEQPERPLALRLPAGEGRQLRQGMVQLAKRLQVDIPRRLAEPDVKAESERIEQAYKSEESRAYADLNTFAQARHFSLMREQGQLVFSCQDEQGEPLTTGKAMALCRLAGAQAFEALQSGAAGCASSAGGIFGRGERQGHAWSVVCRCSAGLEQGQACRAMDRAVVCVCLQWTA